MADDCDDNNSDINPSSAEIVYNGIDDDCDPTSLDDDLDGDGFELLEDCDDEDASINPDAMSIPDNGIDENCDGFDPMTSSIHDLNGTTLKIYPNPTSDIINIETDQFLGFEVIIYDLEGKQILQSFNKNQIDIKQLISGVYILTVTELNSMKQISERIQVIH